MADSTAPGLSDLMALFGNSNPFSGIAKSISQFQRGVGQFLESVERFNETMEQLNGVARRVNGLLDTVEEPIKAFVPQVTRTLRAADAMVEQLSGPIDLVAPSLNRFAETISHPTLLALPNDLSEFMGILGDLARRLQPLGQLAESAGSMFGLNPLAMLRGAGTKPAPAPAPPPPAPAPAPAKKAVAKKKAPAKSTTKKATARKATAKKATAKKSR